MKIKLISSLEKCFLDDDINLKQEYTRGSCFKNEIFRFGCCYTLKEICDNRKNAVIEIVSPIKEYVNVRIVEQIPVQLAACRLNNDNDYLRKEPGLYPDLLLPLEQNPRICLTNTLKSLFVEVDTKGEAASGVYPIELLFIEPNTREELGKAVFELEIIDALLPEQELIFTQWFHCDCLMSHYGTKTFDEEHWRIIENFIKTAVKNGMNMILTPVFTPALDTCVGGERPTTQLVDITLDENGYSFGFEKLGRWIAMSKRLGIKYFEIPHFFTQWGAKYAPKIVAKVNGEEKRIFGWDTDAVSQEYREFLNAFIPALIEYLKEQGVDKNTVFHVSDEPNLDKLEDYKKAREVVKPLLEGYTIMDALSHYEFYTEGIVENPVPSNDALEKFLENKVPNLWTYYCIGQGKEVSNRFMSMPSYRNRIIGMQMYKFDIVGFLHWGYNFYYNQYSYAKVNPFICPDADSFAPAGDAHSVYPAPDGTTYESIRIAVFHDAIQDMRALKLCEQLYGKEYTLKLLEEGIEPLTFKKYPRSEEYILTTREKVNNAIKAKLN